MARAVSTISLWAAVLFAVACTGSGPVAPPVRPVLAAPPAPAPPPPVASLASAPAASPDAYRAHREKIQAYCKSIKSPYGEDCGELALWRA